MKEKIKKFFSRQSRPSNKEIFVAVLVLLIVMIYFFSNIDVGLFGKYFIKKDFEIAFLARQTGNCEKFVSYMLIDRNNWLEKCEKERDGKTDPIKDFIIQKITIDGNNAFLQVELRRDIYRLPEVGYLVNYQMKKQGNKWFINQRINK